MNSNSKSPTSQSKFTITIYECDMKTFQMDLLYCIEVVSLLYLVEDRLDGITRAGLIVSTRMK